MNVLALNCGSATVKCKLIAIAPGARAEAGRVLGSHTEEVRDDDHAGAVGRALDGVRAGRGLDAVGHRVVHGGSRFVATTALDERTVDAIEALEALAPLHNRPSVAGMRACRAALGPRVPMAAVFDTAFHATLPAHAARYAIAPELADRHGVRRFGFHGISYAWATARTAALLTRPVGALRLVILHLGSGCSAAAIDGGRSVETSMGLTPLEGLVMRTRAGDVDPALPGFLAGAEGVTIDEVGRWLNERSGLAGLAGGTGDVRQLLAREASDPAARVALEVFCHRARKYVGAYLAVLGGADALVFTGGIGEHQPEIRRRIAQAFAWCGLSLDDRRNHDTTAVDGEISADASAMRALVVVADEERMIAAETAACLASAVPKARA